MHMHISTNDKITLYLLQKKYACIKIVISVISVCRKNHICGLHYDIIVFVHPSIRLDI